MWPLLTPFITSCLIFKNFWTSVTFATISRYEICINFKSFKCRSLFWANVKDWKFWNLKCTRSVFVCTLLTSSCKGFALWAFLQPVWLQIDERGASETPSSLLVVSVWLIFSAAHQLGAPRRSPGITENIIHRSAGPGCKLGQHKLSD